MTNIPYDEIEPTIAPLVRALNALPGIRTIGSCGGHDNPDIPWQKPLGEWYVTFWVDHTPDGWRALEAITGACSWVDDQHSMTVSAGMSYAVGERGVFFMLDGAQVTPDAAATIIALCYEDPDHWAQSYLPHELAILRWKLGVRARD